MRDAEARQTLTELRISFRTLKSASSKCCDPCPKLLAGKQAAKVIATEAEPDGLGAKTRFQLRGMPQPGRSGSPHCSSTLSLLLGAALAYLFLNEARVRQARTERENQRNQEAILRSQ